ncbi:MAG: type III polyketide synthase [Parachlamydiales bacterium]
MNPSILSLATALPEHGGRQEVIVESVIQTLGLQGADAEKCRRIFCRSGIEHRYTVAQDFLQSPLSGELFGQDYPNRVPGTGRRNELYWREAPKLAEKSARKALEQWGGNPEGITHILHASCTGVMAPGIEFLLTDALGLRRSVVRLGINNMGCFGAFSVLKVAKAFARENPKARILAICTELCSLHFQADNHPEAFVSNALFADGSAAVVVGCEPTADETSLWEIGEHRALAFEESLDQMTWRAGDTGYLMTLTEEVPLSIRREIRQFVAGFGDLEGCQWAFHPGGKAILHGIGMACGLTKEQLAPSWEVLRKYGNMSSPTFLFVLEELLEKRGPTIGVGFGPGLSMEGLKLT